MELCMAHPHAPAGWLGPCDDQPQPYASQASHHARTAHRAAPRQAHPARRQWPPSTGRWAETKKGREQMRYVSFIHQEDATCGISFPDFPGCVSVGDTVDEAVRHGGEALALHVEGLVGAGESIPPPRPIAAIKADPDLADWRRGADFVLIPLLLDRGSSRRVSISLDTGLLEAIDDEARQRRMTRSAFLATAARREMQST